MPELPEVETVVRDLRPELIGRCFTAVRASGQVLRRRWSPSWAKVLTGRRVAQINRRGKWIVMELEEGPHLVIHLGMTGQLFVLPRTAPQQNHTHLVFSLDNGRQLRFRDIRRFGSATLFANAQAVARFFDEKGLGPEPFVLEAAYFRQQLARTQRCLKAILLDQGVVAGVGNIYADESLFEAKLHPRRCGADLSSPESQRLRRAIVVVLRRAIDKRGSSIRNYVGGSGQRGQYQDEFRVYGRTGQPCVRCRTTIAKMVLAGRSTHYCPQCQPSE